MTRIIDVHILLQRVPRKLSHYIFCRSMKQSIASRAATVIVSGSDGRGRLWSQLNMSSCYEPMGLLSNGPIPDGHVPAIPNKASKSPPLKLQPNGWR